MENARVSAFQLPIVQGKVPIAHGVWNVGVECWWMGPSATATTINNINNIGGANQNADDARGSGANHHSHRYYHSKLSLQPRRANRRRERTAEKKAQRASKLQRPERQRRISASTVLSHTLHYLSSFSTTCGFGKIPSQASPTSVAASFIPVPGTNIVADLVVGLLAVGVIGLASLYFFRRTSADPSRRKRRRGSKQQQHKKDRKAQPEPLLDTAPKHNTMSVVGIDFGTLNTVVAVARNRGIDVIVNEVSNRATPSLVSFGEKQRYLGESAKTQEISNFKNTVGGLKRLIGRPFSDPDVKLEKKFINANLTEGERGEVAASVWFQEDQRQYTFTQLASMFLTKVKEFTSKEISIPVTDAVISCPGWFTEHQRRALLDAADVAGINVLKVLNDTTASALGYGITKVDLPDPTDAKAKPRIVVFFDLGYSSTQISVVSFVKGKLIVKGTAYDRNLGGRDFDEVLVQHYTKEFTEKYKIDIASNAKAIFRLRQGCEKVKKILSANAVTVLNVECLMDDKDVSAQVQRSDYEEWASPLIQRLSAPLKAALDAAGVTAEEVDFVELIGGSTRIPAVKQTLADLFGADKLSTTLNQDEAVARGCALQCAMISPVFKVRDFAIQDWNGYPVELSWDAAHVPTPTNGEKPETVMEAFPIGNAIPSSKILTFYRVLKDEEISAQGGSVSLDIDAAYSEKRAERTYPEGIGAKIGTWTLKGIKKVGGVTEQANGAPEARATIKVKTRLDGNGLVAIESASQIEEQLVPVEEPKKEAEKKDEATPMDVDSPAAESPAEPAAGDGPKTKRIIKKHDLTIVARTSAAPAELLNKWKDEEGQMAVSDRLVIDTAEVRNALEEYVYDTRSKVDSAWNEFITEASKATFLKDLNAMEDWLYTEEGESATKGVYAEKLAGLQKVGDPVKRRFLEREERPRTEKQLREYINSVIVNTTAGDDRYAHIAKEDLDKVVKECQTKLAWLNDVIAKTNEQPKHQDPAVTIDQLQKEREYLHLIVNPILSRPKPAPKKEEPKEEPKKEEATKDEKPATPKPEGDAKADKEADDRMDVD
ncbi:Hsp70 protein-domain-containing protein [Fimicolochytrium jonesii]|uniref:Hsp70 protein-domain-containing protein n=1 Tax=Fimicolochytrium jonesii TaxID=1396493 RepID=UPI0022FDC431|nr:Hsp70 protein-domain-containing protein [Fimicolochytrium jonesii]KAI8819335.1 Hsp70 protein-domain-containing protein [Fimicolochytrium jonesii]